MFLILKAFNLFSLFNKKKNTKKKQRLFVGLKPYMLYFSSRFCRAQKVDKKNTHIAYTHKDPPRTQTISLSHTDTHARTHRQVGPCAYRH